MKRKMNKLLTTLFSIGLIAFGCGMLTAKMAHPADNLWQIAIPAEAEETLQQNPETTYAKVVEQFRSKGGTLIKLTLANSPQDSGINSFAPQPDDAFYPICTAGYCRSQTLWSLMKPYEDKIVLFPPHATRMGFDPYNGKENWHANKYKESLSDEFSLWAGFNKAERFGFDVFADWYHKENIPAEELESIGEFYSTYYFGPESSWHCQKGTRRIYIAFVQNNHVIMHRLNQSNERLDDVVVVHIPLPDLITNPLKEWKTQPRTVKSYENFASLLRQLFDFSELQ